MNREVSVLIIPVKRPCRKAKVSAPFGKRAEPVLMQPTFNTDVFKNGEAIEISHHTGEVARGIIAESRKDWIKTYIVDKLGNCLVREIELEDYISGTWRIKLL